MRAFSSGLVLACLVVANADAQDHSPTELKAKSPVRPPGVGQEDVNTGLAVAFGLPRIVAMNAYLSRSLVVEAVYQATALSGAGMMGQVANTGTLSPGYGGGFQYSPQPSDRLVVNLGPQQVHEFVISQAQGNMQARTATEWVMSPHVLQYVHRLQGQAEAEMTAQFNGAQFQVQVRGWYTQSGTRYDINERHASSMASATSLRLLPSQRGSASRFNGTLNNVLRVGADEYSFQNVQLQTDQRTRGTATGQAGLTMLDGVVLRSGQPFARFVLQGGRAFLQTQSEMIPLDMVGGGSIR